MYVAGRVLICAFFLMGVPALHAQTLPPSSVQARTSHPSKSQDGAEQRTQGRPAIRPHFVARSASYTPHLVGSERIELPTLQSLHPELGIPFELPIHIKGRNIVAIDVATAGPNGYLEGKSNGVPIGSGSAKIVAESPGSEVAEVVPLQVGKVDLIVYVVFSDGAIAQKTATLNVGPPKTGVTRFGLDGGFIVVGLRLGGKASDSEMWLGPEVECKGLDYPVYLADSSFLNLKVQQPNDPVIQVTPAGHIQALRPGEAVITGTFSGKEAHLEVIVAAPGARDPHR